jgi:hypothetical protein
MKDENCDGSHKLIFSEIIPVSTIYIVNYGTVLLLDRNVNAK